MSKLTYRIYQTSKKWRRDLLICLILTLVVFLIGIYLKAWTGYLKGDDAYLHISRITYILHNFPHLNWMHEFFNGYPPFQFEVPTYYLPVALVHTVTGASIELLIQLGLAFSMIFLGLSIYVLCRTLGLQRILSTGLALLIFTIPIVWNWSIIGGAYTRVAALPLLFVSLTLAYRHVREINEKSEKIRTYVLTVVTFMLLAVLHPLIWQWTCLMALAIYLLGIKSWSHKFYHLARTFLPVAFLAAWVYVPLFIEYTQLIQSAVSGLPVHDTALMEWRWLVYIPTTNTWSIDIGPLILPLALFSLVLAVTYQTKIRKAVRVVRLELLIVIVMVAFSIYFFTFGWLPMPKTLYLMAAYDYAMWFGISLLLVSVFSFSIFIKCGLFSRLKGSIISVAKIFFVILVLGCSLVNVPFLKQFTSLSNPLDINSFNHGVKEIVEVARANNPPQYRLLNYQRRLQSWLYSEYPDIQTTGGRSNYIPHKYYNQWADSTVSYQLDKKDISDIYYEDMPKVSRDTIGGEQNFYSSMFWLDWYGASGPILMPPLYPQWQTAQGYASRSQFYQEYKAPTRFGDLFFYKYPDSSPIAVSTQSPAVAVPFQSGDAPTFYTDLLDVFSSLNINSQWIIPVKLENSQDLDRFDTALVAYPDYTENKDILDEFAEKGGHLIVVGVVSSPSIMVTAHLSTPELSFTVEASPLAAPDGSVILCESGEGVLAFKKQWGSGTITFSGISLGDLVACDSPAGAVLLAAVIAPEINTNQVNAQLDSSKVAWTTNGTLAGISNSSTPGDRAAITPLFWGASWNTENAHGTVSVQGEYVELMAKMNGGDSHDQVNFSAYLSDSVAVKSAGTVEFDVWCEGEPVVDVGFLSISQDRYNTHSIEITKGEWVHNLIPLSAFTFPVGDFDASRELLFAVNDNPAAGIIGSDDEVTVRVRDLRISSFGPGENDGKSTLIYVADSSLEYNQVNWEFPLPRQVPADGNALLTFSLWHDGGAMNTISIAMEKEGMPGYVYYDLPDRVWDGWKEFAIPLSSFQLKEGVTISSYDSIILCFNEESQYQPGGQVRQFEVQDIVITDLMNPSSYESLDGIWEQANKFKVTLGGNKQILWKESYMTSWQVTDDKGRQVNYYFAGPGMIYLNAPEDATSLLFEMRVATEFKAGLSISLLSLLVFVTFLIEWHLVQKRRGKHEVV